MRFAAQAPDERQEIQTEAQLACLPPGPGRLARRVRMERERRGFDRSRLCRQAGIAHMQLHLIERATWRRWVAPVLLVRLALALETAGAELFNDAYGDVAVPAADDPRFATAVAHLTARERAKLARLPPYMAAGGPVPTDGTSGEECWETLHRSGHRKGADGVPVDVAGEVKGENRS